jgi:hypothetical protein
VRISGSGSCVIVRGIEGGFCGGGGLIVYFHVSGVEALRRT